MDTLCLGFLYFGNSLRSIKTGLGWFSNPRKALKMVFGVRSIRVFSKFLLDPYHEPLLWFMIYCFFNQLTKWNDLDSYSYVAKLYCFFN